MHYARTLTLVFLDGNVATNDTETTLNHNESSQDLTFYHYVTILQVTRIDYIFPY